VITAGEGRVPPKTEVYVKIEEDEVIVFKDFFSMGLRFPLDYAMVEIFCWYGVYLHQMTPNSMLRLNLFMWLTKTCGVAPSMENFARVSRVQY